MLNSSVKARLAGSALRRARHKRPVCDRRLDLLDELPRNRVVLDASVTNGDEQRIGMRSERHIPEREDDTIVGVAEPRVGGVMQTVKFRSDRETVHERGNSAANHAEARTFFYHALDVARAQQAKSLELRTAVSLSRLWQHQGQRAEARELLASIYG